MEEYCTDTITVFHWLNSTEVIRKVFKNVYFEQSKGISIAAHGVDNASSGLIIIPEANPQEMIISEKDIIVSGEIKQEITEDYRPDKLQKEYKTYTVVAVDDLRKGNLPHWEITLK